MASANLILTSITTVTVVVAFFEPTANVDGTPITNLE